MKRFENKIALVTGGANGLGENLVRRLVSEGAKVAVVDIEGDTIKKVCESMPEDTFGVECDVRDKASVDAMVAKVAELKALLVERRAALITDVVTGRKKIPS